MPRKPDQHFGALPTSSKRLPCDFSGMRGVRARRVTINFGNGALNPSIRRGHSAKTARDLSRGVPRPDLIRSDSMVNMRGALREIRARIRARRTGLHASNRIAKAPHCAFRRLSANKSLAHCSRYVFVFFLLCLTVAAIFDNRHGLFKKFDCGRAAETLSAVQPQK